MAKENGFGVPEREDTTENYIGQYVSLTIHNNGQVHGKLNEITKDGWAIVNPYQGGVWDSEKGLTLKLIDKSRSVLSSSIIDIQPTTRKNLESYIKYSNTHRQQAQNR